MFHCKMLFVDKKIFGPAFQNVLSKSLCRNLLFYGHYRAKEKKVEYYGSCLGLGTPRGGKWISMSKYEKIVSTKT